MYTNGKRQEWSRDHVYPFATFNSRKKDWLLESKVSDTDYFGKEAKTDEDAFAGKENIWDEACSTLREAIYHPYFKIM